MNTLEDFQRLCAALASYDLPVRIEFEATGNYHRALTHNLDRAGFDLKQVSSVGLARTREALRNSWDKNDPKDAQAILHILEIGAVHLFRDIWDLRTAHAQHTWQHWKIRWGQSAFNRKRSVTEFLKLKTQK